MTIRNCSFVLISAALLALVSCRPDAPDPQTQIREIDSPAGASSREPYLTTSPGGETYLSWVEISSTDPVALKFSAKTADGWSEPRTIVQTDDMVVNYADFPSLLAYSGQSLAAHWPAVTFGEEGYQVKVALSHDGGATWTSPVTPHRDGTPTEHGFVSLVPSADGGVVAIWLDGRKFMDPESDEVSMMYTTIGADGTAGADVVVDPRVCECCQTSAVTVDDGILAVYRDRSENEIRDISVVHFDGNQWSSPTTVAADSWEIYGCPVNGPAVAANGGNVAVAWFTGASDQLRVQVAFSTDGGETFGMPIQVDDGNPLGRVDLLMLDSGNALVSWLERNGEVAEVRARKVPSSGGERQPHWVAGVTSVTTSSGFPRMERSGNQVVFAWTDPEQDRVRTSVLTLPDE